MIRTRPVLLQPRYTHEILRSRCATAGTIAEHLDSMKRLVGADNMSPANSVGSSLNSALGQLISVSDDLQIVSSRVDEEPPSIEAVLFDQTTGLAFLSLFIGERRDEAPFFAGFGLTEDERTLIDEGTLGYVFAYIPDDPENSESIPGVAVLALGDDAWEYDGYLLPLELRARLLTAAKQALATP